ncbi:unnamed protein product [Caenorhabditis brenneri]
MSTSSTSTSSFTPSSIKAINWSRKWSVSNTSYYSNEIGVKTIKSCVRRMCESLGIAEKIHNKTIEELNGRHGDLEGNNCKPRSMRGCREKSMKCQLNFAVLKGDHGGWDDSSFC